MYLPRYQMLKSHSKLFFPSSDLPVTKLLEFTLPKTSNGITGAKTKAWFSSEAPVTDTECLQTRPIPQEKILDQLLKDFGQAWFDGTKSVVDPRFNDGCDRLPLWTNKLPETAEQPVTLSK